MLRALIAAAAVVASAEWVLAEDNLLLGQQVFGERCGSCHTVGDAAPKNAPSLNDVIGRPAASLEGFKYSDAMREAGQAGVVWDVETLHKFITKPRSVVNGSNMSFTGLRNPDDVANVIAYLATFSRTAQK